jgi:hypothetical protein
LVGGTFATNRKHLNDAMQKRKYRGGYHHLLRATPQILDKLRLPKLRFSPTPAHIPATRINPKAFPGCFSSKISRTRGGGHAVFQTLAQKKMAKTMEAGAVPDRSLWQCGGRGKRAGKKLGEELSSRLVLMDEAPDCLVSASLCQPITDALVKYDGPIQIGRSYYYGNFKKHVNHWSKMEHVKTTDTKSFDSSTPEELIVYSFALLSTCYPDTPETEKLFLQECSHLLFKNVITPGGYVYRLYKGVPSGSPWTSILDSIANFSAFYTSLAHAKGDASAFNADIVTAGDDIKIGWLNHTFAPTTAKLIKVVRFLWGYEVVREGTGEGFFTSAWPDQCASFLATIFPSGLPGMHLGRAVAMWVVHTTKRRYDPHVEAQAWDFMSNSPPFTLAAGALRKAFMQFCFSKLPGMAFSDPAAYQEVHDTMYTMAAVNYLSDHTPFTYKNFEVERQTKRMRVDMSEYDSIGFKKTCPPTRAQQRAYNQLRSYFPQ